MKRFKALIVIGGILLIIGLIAAVNAPANKSQDTAFTVQNGGYYSYLTLPGLFTGEQLTFNYTLHSGGTIDVYLLDSGAYSTYAIDGTVVSSLYANPGSVAGSGSVVIPAGGTYYIVINHGTGSTASDQSGSMSVHASGLDVTVLTIGIIFAAIGIVLLAFGQRMRSKQVRAPPGFAPPSQVTMFPSPGSGTGLPPSPQQPPQEPWPPTGPPPR